MRGFSASLLTLPLPLPALAKTKSKTSPLLDELPAKVRVDRGFLLVCCPMSTLLCYFFRSSPRSVNKLIKPSSPLEQLRSVPTWAITDSRGVPYMVVDDNAQIVAYFFTSYDEARRVLKSATKATEKGNIWKGATITPLSLDAAVELSLKGKASTGGVNFKLAPAQEDLDKAIELTNLKNGLPEGKVPLFFSDKLKVPGNFYDLRKTKKKASTEAAPDQAGTQVKPLFFSLAELEDAWKIYGDGGDAERKAAALKNAQICRDNAEAKAKAAAAAEAARMAPIMAAREAAADAAMKELLAEEEQEQEAAAAKARKKKNKGKKK